MHNLETGDSSGYYMWDTNDDTKIYNKPVAMRFMTNRSLPGPVSFKILLPNRMHFCRISVLIIK